MIFMQRDKQRTIVDQVLFDQLANKAKQ